MEPFIVRISPSNSSSLKMERVPDPPKECLVPPARKSRAKSRGKRSKSKQQSSVIESASPLEDGSSAAKKRRYTQLLKGITLSVSTLKDGPDDKQTSKCGDNDVWGYNEVCQICKEMGAQVTSQVSKRVQLLLCTRSAVERATQRVRKAYKKKVPMVDVMWLQNCRKEGYLISMEPFRLDEEAKHAISHRENNIAADSDEVVDVPEDAGWSEPVSFGCSCVCHENGTQKDCQWCSDGCAA